MPINVSMTSPGGVTLATGGKYCPENVKVTPTLQTLSVTPTAQQQVINPESGNVGFSQVTVAAAPAGGAEIQRKSGTFTTGSDGTASASCGFMPDLVVIHQNRSGAGGVFSAAAAFDADTRADVQNIVLYEPSDDFPITFIGFAVTQTSSGFAVDAMNLDNPSSPSAWANQTCSYVAVKYAASGSGGTVTPTYTITRNLTHVTASNATATVQQGGSYSVTLTAQSGYQMSSVTVTMGGANITASAYNSATGVVSIASVTGNIIITATATAVSVMTHSVTINLPDGVEAEILSGGEIMQSGEKLTVKITSKTAGYLLDAPTATMGGSSADLTSYLTTGTKQGERCKTFTISNLPITGNFVLNVTGASTGYYLQRCAAEGGTCNLPSNTVNEAFRQPGGAIQFEYEPSSGYKMPDGAWDTWSALKESGCLAITDLNTGAQVPFSEFENSSGSKLAPVAGSEKYRLQYNSLSAMDLEFRVTFAKA